MNELEAIEQQRNLQPEVMVDWIMRYITGLKHKNIELERRLAEADPLIRRLTERLPPEELEKARKEFDEKHKGHSSDVILVDVLMPHIEKGMTDSEEMKLRILRLRDNHLQQYIKLKDNDERAKNIKETYAALDQYREEIKTKTLNLNKLRIRINEYMNQLNNLGQHYNGAIAILETEIARLHQIGGDTLMRALGDIHLIRVPTTMLLGESVITQFSKPDAGRRQPT